MDVYTPSNDSFLLLDATLDEINKNDFVLDVGTGTGIIAEELKKRSYRVVATDINYKSVKKALSKGINSVRTNLFDCIDTSFDLIVFNPPYLPSIKKNTPLEKALDGGKTGTEVTKEFLNKVDRILEDTGRVLVVASDRSDISSIKDFGDKKGFFVDTVSEKKLFFERLVVLRLQYQ